MATQDFTNQLASQSLNGQAVIVTVNGTDAANLYKLREGQLATNLTSNKTGTVHSVDVYGTSFRIMPIQPDKNFDSAPTVYGYLRASETVTVTL